MIQYLFYACTDKYERSPLAVVKQMVVNDDNLASMLHENAKAHEAQFREYFAMKEYSALHILVLKLDVYNGVTEVIRNELSLNDLRQRIVINERAKAKGVRKTATQALQEQLMAQQAMASAQPMFSFDEASEPFHD